MSKLKPKSLLRSSYCDTQDTVYKYDNQYFNFIHIKNHLHQYRLCSVRTAFYLQREGVYN